MAKVKLLDPSDPRRRLDRYELIGEIATGGMATVFLARLGGVGGFQRFVAIKRLHPHLANEQEFVEMFLDEARLAALIHHPHVVPILEVGVTDAGYYIVMEYVEGDTLSKIVARSMSTGRMVPRHILMRALLDTLAGLHAAHDLADERGQLLGLVHRDVSPQNVLVGIDGSSRITDFGVARATARLTSTGSGKLKGKLAYMAPEQTRGDELDRRTDLFAAGIIVWECLAGKRLFKAETEAATLNRILVEPVRPVSEVNPDVPKLFDYFALKALDRNPKNRFQTALEMGDALEHTAIEAAKLISGEPAIASPREVASYVQTILGQEIGAQRESVRAWLAQSDSGQPRISLPVRPPRRPHLNSETDDSDVSSPKGLAVAFARTELSPAKPFGAPGVTGPLDSNGDLPATRVEPAILAVAVPAPAPSAPGLIPDTTFRFGLDGRRVPPPIPTPPPTIPDSVAPTVPRTPPPKPTLMGQGPPVPLPAPSPSVGLGTVSLTEDNEDAPTILKSDKPLPGSVPVHKDPSKAVVVPSVKTARGLFASDVLSAAKEYSVAKERERAANASSAMATPPPPVSVRPSDGPVVPQTSSLTNASMTLPSDGVAPIDPYPPFARPQKGKAVLVVLFGLAACAVFCVWFFTRGSDASESTANATAPSTTAQTVEPTHAPPPPPATQTATATASAAAAPVSIGHLPAASPVPGPRPTAKPSTTSAPTAAPKDTASKGQDAKAAPPKAAPSKDGPPKDPGDDLSNPYK